MSRQRHGIDQAAKEKKEEGNEELEPSINGHGQAQFLGHVIAASETNWLSRSSHQSGPSRSLGRRPNRTNALSQISRGQCQQQFIEAAEPDMFLSIWHLPRQQRVVDWLSRGKAHLTQLSWVVWFVSF